MLETGQSRRADSTASVNCPCSESRVRAMILRCAPIIRNDSPAKSRVKAVLVSTWTGRIPTLVISTATILDMLEEIAAASISQGEVEAAGPVSDPKVYLLLFKTPLGVESVPSPAYGPSFQIACASRNICGLPRCGTDLFEPHWVSVRFPKGHSLIAPNHGAGDQGLVSVVDDPRPDHFDLISFAKTEFLVTKKSQRGNMHREGAVIGLHQEVGSDVAADRTVKLLHVLHDAFYASFVGGAVNRHPMPRASKE